MSQGLQEGRVKCKDPLVINGLNDVQDLVDDLCLCRMMRNGSHKLGPQQSGFGECEKGCHPIGAKDDEIQEWTVGRTGQFILKIWKARQDQGGPKEFEVGNGDGMLEGESCELQDTLPNQLSNTLLPR